MEGKLKMKKTKFIIIVILGIIAYFSYDHKAFKDLFNSIFSHKTTYENTIEDYTKEIEQKPDDVWNYSFRGTSYLKIKKYDLALNDFNKAISLNEKFFPAYTEKSLALLCLGKHDEALKTINKVISEWPGRITYYLIKGLIYDDKSDVIEANKNYTSFLNCEVTEDSIKKISFAFKRRAINFYKLGKIQESYNDIEKITKLQKENSDLKEILDTLSKLKNLNNNSIKLNEKILTLNLEEAISILLNIDSEQK